MASISTYFQGKTAIVTGGSSGIGLAVARILAENGCSVAILARRKEALESARQEIISIARDGVRVLALSTDVSDQDSVNAAVDTAISEFKGIDLLVNSAGVTMPGEFEKLSTSVFRDMMEIDYFGTLYAIQAVLPNMLKQGQGAIVNISSVVGYLNIYGYSAYGAAKYAISGLSDAMRMELKPKGIQVSLVFPPDTDTPQLAFEQPFKPEATKVLASNGGEEKPEKVAKEILAGVAAGKYIINPGFSNKLIYFAVRLLGRGLVYSLMDRMIRPVLKRNSPANP